MRIQKKVGLLVAGFNAGFEPVFSRKMRENVIQFEPPLIRYNYNFIRYQPISRIERLTRRAIRDGFVPSTVDEAFIGRMAKAVVVCSCGERVIFYKHLRPRECPSCHCQVTC